MLVRHAAILTAAAFAAALLCSCASIKYDGPTRESSMDRASVKTYYDKSQIPVKDYKEMGPASVSVPANFSSSKAQSLLLEKAKECGADGVLVISIDKTPAGAARSDQVLNQDASNKKPLNISDGFQKAFETHSEPQPEESYCTTVNAIFLSFPNPPPPDKPFLKKADQSK